MKQLSATLKDGLTVGDTLAKAAVLRQATAADLISASEEAAVVAMTPDGYKAIVNDVVAGILVLGKQVVSIGELPGPLNRAMLGKLSERDLEILQDKADELVAFEDGTPALPAGPDDGAADASQAGPDGGEDGGAQAKS